MSLAFVVFPVRAVTFGLKFKLSFKSKKKKIMLLAFYCEDAKATILECFDLHIFSWYFQCCVNVWYSCLIVVIVFSDSGSSIISKAHSKSSVLRKNYKSASSFSLISSFYEPFSLKGSNERMKDFSFHTLYWFLCSTEWITRRCLLLQWAANKVQFMRPYKHRYL